MWCGCFFVSNVWIIGFTHISVFVGNLKEGLKMAFLIDATMKGYECRGISTGTSKRGNTFKTIRVESPDGRTAEISCTDANLFGAVDSLRRAAVYNFDVRAVAGRERSYLQLLAAPLLVDDATVVI